MRRERESNMQAKQIKIAEAQAEIHEWSTRNFGAFVDVQKFINLSSFLGMVEELGELAHAILKQAQGIRGTKEEHDEAIDDAIADLMVFTLDFAGRNNKDLESIFNRVWAKVKERDWKKNPQLGIISADESPEVEEAFSNAAQAPKSYNVPVIRDLLNLPHLQDALSQVVSELPVKEGEKD
jgi:NTP pyrophosphatase (non-canonical NTP hydrolase)